MMDFYDGLDFGMFLFLSFCSLFVIGLVLQLAIFVPLQAEDASKQCFERGAKSYLDFTGLVFSTKALAVRCEYPTTNSNIDLGIDGLSSIRNIVE